MFADLNLPRAYDLMARAEVAAKIIAEIQRRRLTHGQAATILGIHQPKVAAIKQGKLSGFSIERLIGFLFLGLRVAQIGSHLVPDNARTERNVLRKWLEKN